MAKRTSVSCLQFCGESVTVTRKPIKNLHLRIKPFDGSISVSAPYRITDPQILDFLEKHAAWIKRHRSACQSIQKPEPLSDGAQISLLGDLITLRVLDLKKSGYAFDGAILSVGGRDLLSPSLASVERFYRDRMREAVEPMLAAWSRRLKTPDVLLRLRTMTSRWGSCHVKKRVVTLNLRLALYPKPLLEYVLVHELLHFYHPNHSPAFYAAFSIHLPDFRERKRTLEDLARQNVLPDPFLR